jgi:hypothetical protein
MTPQQKWYASHPPEYHVWKDMISRCYTPTRKNFAYYGGRGVTVCARWRKSYAAFFADMKRRPSARHELDRYPDKNGPYAPDNCRWATKRQQQQNIRTNHILEFCGLRQCITEWARQIGISPQALYYRLSRSQMSVKEALTRPPRQYGGQLCRPKLSQGLLR